MTTIAKLFKSGRSQAVRLPREFRFEGDRVRVRRAGRGVLVEPMFTDVAAWFAELDRLGGEPLLPDEKGQRRDANAQRVDAFLAAPLEWTLFDDEDARESGVVRAELERAGGPIGAYDLLLAGQARRRGATLVTSNVREFARVAGLRWEDWATARRSS